MTTGTKNFILLHKNIPVLRFAMRGWEVEGVLDVYHEEHAPIGSMDRYGIEWKKFLEWFRSRSIPASRDHIHALLERLGMSDTGELLLRNYALSLYDQYWIRPEGEEVRWEEINFFENDFSESWGDRLLGEEVAGDGAYPDLRTPDNTSGGWLRKRWKIHNGKRYLYKGGSAPYRQEPLNEHIATLLCQRLGIRHISYDLVHGHTGLPYSVCENHITPQTELVTARQMSTLSRRREGEDYLQQYIRICHRVGIGDIEEEISRMLVVDYIMANRDRHWANFGVVRNADDLSFIGTFPIFDTGTSLWNDAAAPEIGNGEIAGQVLRCSLERHLDHVTDRDFLAPEELRTFPAEAEAVLASSSFVTGERAGRIADCLRERLRYLEQWLVKGNVFLREGLAPYDRDYIGRAVAGSPEGPVYAPDDDAPGILDGGVYAPENDGTCARNGSTGGW